MKIRITGKSIPKYQSRGEVKKDPMSKSVFRQFTDRFITDPIGKFLTQEPSLGLATAGLFDPTGATNAPFVYDSFGKLVENPSFSNASGLAWDVLGSIPVFGEVVRLAGAPAKLSRLQKLGKTIPGKIAKGAFKDINRVMGKPARVGVKAVEKTGIKSPMMMGDLGQWNRGQRFYEHALPATGEATVNILDRMFPGTPQQKAYGGESNNTIKIRIVGKGLAKAQYQNSQIGQPYDPFGVTKMLQQNLPVDQQPYNVTPPMAPPPIFQGGFNSNQEQDLFKKLGQGVKTTQSNALITSKTNIGDTDVFNSQNKKIGQYKNEVYTADPVKAKKPRSFSNTIRDIDYGIDMGMATLGIASNWYNNRQVQKDQALKERLSNLPDNQVVAPGDNKGMWTTNEGWQNPMLQYTVNQGQTTNQFYPQIGYAADGMEVVGMPNIDLIGDRYTPSTYIDRPYIMPSAASAPQPQQEVKAQAAVTPSITEGGQSIRDIIAQKESGGNYKALAKKKDGTLASSAVGKYQFLWNKHKDWIEKVTGINSKEDFRNNPTAQEKAFDYWDENILTPNAKRIKKELKVDLPIENLKYAIHFAGPAGAYRYFATGEETTDYFKKTTVEGITKMNLGSNSSVNDLSNFANQYGFDITSTTGGKHNTGSKHYQGKAIDVRTRNKTPEEIAQFIQLAQQQGYKVLDERDRPAGQAVWSGPHLHLEKASEGLQVTDICPPGFAWDGELEKCVKLPADFEPSASSSPVSNQIPIDQIAAATGRLPSQTQLNMGKPVGVGFNINNAQGENPGTYGITAGYQGQVGKNALTNSSYNLGLNFPALFGKGRGLKITGKYGNNNLNLGANANIRLGRGNLVLKGGYTAPMGSQSAGNNSQDFMKVPTSSSKGNANLSAEWNKKLGNTNVKITGYYGANPSMANGGEKNNNMKIRIVGLPESNMAYGGEPFDEIPSLFLQPVDRMQKAAYGGQSGYGFDLGQRNTYSEMNHNPYEKSSKSLGPVPRDQANIEAEKGETVYGDLNNDGQKEHMNIGGERHTNGGTPLNVPEGSFIFSDTKKMRIKDAEVLKFFGLSPKAGGYTPAEIAKKYDINKYIGILKDPYADSVKKATAERMIDNYEKKLGYLALIQESMKGFPQGIPEVAENIMGGGMGQEAPQQQSQQEEIQQSSEEQNPEEEQMEEVSEEQIPMEMYGGEGYYANGGMAYNQLSKAQDGKTFRVKDKDITAKKVQTVPSDYNPYTGIPNLYWRQGKQGKKHIPNENAWWRSLTPAQKAAHNVRIKSDSRYTGTPDDYVYIEDQPINKKPKDPIIIPGKSKMTVIAPSAEEWVDPNKPPADVPGVPNIEQSESDPGMRWDFRDRRNATNALLDYSKLRKDIFDYNQVTPVIPKIAMNNWLAKVQTRQGTFNKAAEQLAQSLPGQALASNYSFLQGQTGEGTSQDIDQTGQTNTAIYNKNEQDVANILNNAIAYNAAIRDKNRENRFNINRQYDTDERAARKGILTAWNQGDTNMIDRYNFNISESPYYYLDPLTGQMKFNSSAGRAAFEAMKKRGYAGADTGMSSERAIQIYNDVYDRTRGNADQKADAALAAMRALTGGGARTTETEYPYNTLRNNRRTTQVTPQSKFGGSINFGYSYHNPFLR